MFSALHLTCSRSHTATSTASSKQLSSSEENKLQTSLQVTLRPGSAKTKPVHAFLHAESSLFPQMVPQPTGRLQWLLQVCCRQFLTSSFTHWPCSARHKTSRPTTAYCMSSKS